MRVTGLGRVDASASSVMPAARLSDGLWVYWSIEYIEPLGLLEQLIPIKVAVCVVLEAMRARRSLAFLLTGASLHTVLTASLATALAVTAGDAPLYLIGGDDPPRSRGERAAKAASGGNAPLYPYLYAAIRRGPSTVNALEGVLAASHADRLRDKSGGADIHTRSRGAGVSPAPRSTRQGLRMRPRRAYIALSAFTALYSIIPDPAVTAARLVASILPGAAAARQRPCGETPC